MFFTSSTAENQTGEDNVVRYPKEVILKAGEEVCLRLLEPADEEQLCEFYRRIPENDRWYMRFDALDPEALRRWHEGLDSGGACSIVAWLADRVIGHASLRCWGYGCLQHVGRIHIMILPEFRHKRLGTWLMLDLIQLAMDKKMECLRADFIVDQEKTAIEAAAKLDFFQAARLPRYIKDPSGNFHDMQIMLKHLHKHWSDY